MTLFALFAPLAFFYLLSCIRILNAYERMAVFRLGRFLKVVGPGVTFLLLPIDMGVKVRLDTQIPDWQNLGERGLEERVKQIVMEGQKETR
ncbi:MAG: hypothetical protein HYY59_01950 [Candidatus Omnitrophica bacterium]|nr:hypothetical protein [Candidatus Omnitrophota bacterium]MBI3020746.1 hypothetical protein [Candidatus Omnitrophota bacterium]